MLDIQSKHGIFPNLIRRLLTSWLMAVSVVYLLLPTRFRSLADLTGLTQMPLAGILILTAILTVLLFVMSHFIRVPGWERWCLFGAFAVLAAAALSASFTWPFAVICALIAVCLAVYGVWGWDNSPEPEITPQKAHKANVWITAGLAVAFFLFVSAWTAARVHCFSTPTYDFGIFAQMFYNMKESGLPLTTVERDGLLSHFAVHVSPIYYLMLPFYWLFPYPVTLQILQAAVITSAVIPLWLIGKHHGLSGTQRMLVCAVMLLYPAYSGGTSYDIHENCFLTPLILWLFYGIDRKNTPVTAFAAVLTLMVKEDAAVYVAIAALWLIVKTLLRFKEMDRKDLLTGIGLLAVSLLWFFAVTSYLAESGDGVMTYRYNNFIYDGSSSLITVIKAVLMNPMKALYECVDSEKLGFIAQTMLPLLGLPLLTRRYERYILLIPYILVNLMSDYQYQHNIFFQYTFGSTAFLMYLTVVNLADLKLEWHRIVAIGAAVIVAAGFFCSTVVPKGSYYITRCTQRYDYYQNIHDILSQIPDEAAVSATTFYTTDLSQREVLYDVRYASTAHILETEYVVLSVSESGSYKKYASAGNEDGFDNFVALLESQGYELVDSLDHVLVIYQRK